MENIKLSDTVALLEDIEADGVTLTRGAVGAVVETLSPEIFEVEFCDEQGRPLAFASLRADQLLLLLNKR